MKESLIKQVYAALLDESIVELYDGYQDEMRMESDPKILVVDDEPDILFVTARTLKRAGYVVLEARTGSNAIALARQQQPDLILLDMVLPDIDGIEVCRTLKSDDQTSGITIAFISGKKITSDDQSKGLDFGADEYIARPIENRELLARINVLLRLKKAEKELARQRDQLERMVRERTKTLNDILEKAADGICVCHNIPEKPYVRFSHWNPRMTEITGYTMAEINQAGWYQRLYPDPETQKKAIECMADIRQGNDIQAEEWTITTKDNKQKALSVSTSVIKKENGQTHVMAIMQDITEHKQAESKIRYFQKSESLGRMAGAVAHLFNNRLYVVMGNLELVLDILPADTDIREKLFKAFESARKAADLSSQLLRYLGHISGHPKNIHLSEVCQQSLLLVQSTVKKGVQLNVDFPDPGPVVHADTIQIQQVLINLFENAQESLTDNHGVIGLSIQTISHKNISTSNRFPLDWQPQDIFYACLEISDTGCGITSENIVKLFDPFYTSKFIGRGMGLSETMGILKTHGGCIVVDSQPGCGSVFRVYLPVSEEKKTVLLSGQ